MNAYRFITVLVASSYIIEAAARDFIHIKRNDYLDDFGQSNFGGYNLVLVDLLHEGKVPTGIKVPIQQLTIAKADLDESAQLQTLRTFVVKGETTHSLCQKDKSAGHDRREYYLQEKGASARISPTDLASELNKAFQQGQRVQVYMDDVVTVQVLPWSTLQSDSSAGFIRGGRSSFDPKSLDWTPYLPSRKRDTDEIFIPIQYGKSLHGSVRIAMNNDDRVRLWDNDAYWQNRWDYQKPKTPWSMANNFHDWFRGERQRQKFPEHVARVYRGNNLMVTFYTPQKSYGG
eukprot:232160_1